MSARGAHASCNPTQLFADDDRHSRFVAYQGRFPCSRRSHDGQQLPPLCAPVHILQDCFPLPAFALHLHGVALDIEVDLQRELLYIAAAACALGRQARGSHLRALQREHSAAATNAAGESSLSGQCRGGSAALRFEPVLQSRGVPLPPHPPQQS